MTTYTVPSGTYTYSQTLTADTADTVTFPERANYAFVQNLGTDVLYARADGQPATVGGAGVVGVPADEFTVLANGLPLWYQSSRVLVNGDDNANGQSEAGQLANPGTTVSLISASGVPYEIELAG